MPAKPGKDFVMHTLHKVLYTVHQLTTSDKSQEPPPPKRQKTDQ